MQINKYGWPLIRAVMPDEAKDFYEHFYKLDASVSGTVYKCFTNDANRIIWKETTAGNVTTLEFSYGPWDSRTTLTYVPINSHLEV